MNKLQILAMREIEISARTAEVLLHKISHERQFVDALCKRSTAVNDLITLLGKIQRLADAVGENE